MPGVTELPVRQEMPDVTVMNDGTKVTSRQQWRKRREDACRGWSIPEIMQKKYPNWFSPNLQEFWG